MYGEALPFSDIVSQAIFFYTRAAEKVWEANELPRCILMDIIVVKTIASSLG